MRPDGEHQQRKAKGRPLLQSILRGPPCKKERARKERSLKPKLQSFLEVSASARLVPHYSLSACKLSPLCASHDLSPNTRRRTPNIMITQYQSTLVAMAPAKVGARSSLSTQAVYAALELLVIVARHAIRTEAQAGHLIQGEVLRGLPSAKTDLHRCFDGLQSATVAGSPSVPELTEQLVLPVA
eukprot:scaffold1701_cov245-Pinguiococcus_pyrenoidosus.AAC.1